MNYTAVENSILKKVNILLDSFKDQFEDHLITYELNFKKDTLVDPLDYLSEIEINFYKNGDFIDIIEFLISKRL